VPEKDVDRELQWTKAPPIEGVPNMPCGCHEMELNQQSLEAFVNRGLLHAKTSAVNERLLVCRQKWRLAIVALLWCGCAAALNPDLTIKQLVHTAWGPREGAPLGGVQALAQTNDGFLWLRSYSGLYRFDGIAFEHIDLPHDAKLGSTDVLGVFAPRTGGLWVSVFTGGVAFLRDSRWQVYGAQNGLPPSGVIEFAEMPDGTLWVATSVGFGRFDGVHWRTVGADMGLPAGIVPAFVFVDGQGTVWLGASGKMFTLRAGERQFSRFPYSGPMPVASRLVESSAGTLWYDTEDALVKIHQNPTPVTPSSPLAHGPAFDHDGMLWDFGHELGRINPERLRDGVVIPFKADDVPDRYLHTDGLTAGALYNLMVDREGNVWVGTAQGLDRFANPALAAPLRDERNRNALGSVTGIGLAPADGAGGLWVTDTYGAVQRYQDGRLASPALKERISCLLRTDDGTVWFGGRNILWRERQGRFESIPPPGPDGDIQALAVDRSGGLWASIVRSGVFYLKDSVWTPYGGIATLPRQWAITIVRDRRERLWFSYLDGTVAVLDGDQVRIYGAAEGPQIGFVTANYSGGNDQWLGGEFGLARFDGERFHGVRTEPELSLSRITGIVETAAGDLWLNGQSGIVHLPAEELQRSRIDASYRVNGETYGAFDGVVGTGWIRRPLPTAIEAGNGNLWFATSSAFFGVDPNRLVHNPIPPPVVIRSVTVGDHRIDPRPGVTFPVRTTTVRFDYAGLSLTEAQKVRFRYRLDGIDTDWRELTAARQALFTNLRPGHYTFRVIAANNDGVWNESGASLAFVIPAAFVQTGWFIALCVGGGAAAVWALVRLRVHQVRRRLEERMEDRLNERTRIARELHDSLLQGFQGLMFRLQAVRQLLPERSGDAAKFLDSAMQIGDQAIGEGRDAVQNLRSSSFDNRDLATSLSTLGRELAAGISLPSNPQYRAVVEGRPRELTALVRNEAYRIAREAVSNAYQHAKAGHIETEVTFGDAVLTIRVRDDGIGIDAQILARGQRPGHWGLPGMRERSESLGGQLNVWSDRNAGTEVELGIPADIAYSEPRRSSFTRLKNLLRS
jgi:signal transduction histidine kinase/ligand-binding sensor domain-containing protein